MYEIIVRYRKSIYYLKLVFNKTNYSHIELQKYMIKTHSECNTSSFQNK